MDSKIVKKGTKVSWSSSGQGVKSKKTGTVIGFLQGGKDVVKALPNTTLASQIMTRKPKSSHNRYLVRVPVQDGKDLFYVPRTSTIHEQNGIVVKKAAPKKASKPAAKKASKATNKKASKSKHK